MDRKTSAEVKKEMNSLGISKMFRKFGERYVSDTYDGEYGQTYLVLQQEIEPKSGKEINGILRKCVEEIFRIFNGCSILYDCERKWIKIHLKNKIVIVNLLFEDCDVCLKLKANGKENEYSDFKSLVDGILDSADENLCRSIDCSEIEKDIAEFKKEKFVWRCDIMIPDDPWGNTCTKIYGETFTEAFENASRCRAAGRIL